MFTNDVFDFEGITKLNKGVKNFSIEFMNNEINILTTHSYKFAKSYPNNELFAI